MMWRILLVFGCLAGLARAQDCGCTAQSAPDAEEHSDVVFRGTIAGFREYTESSAIPVGDQDPKKFVVFHVTRVWKGEVGPTFEMPALEAPTGCLGFWPGFLKVGNELLVYAGRLRSYTVPIGHEIVTYRTVVPDHPIYYTTICMRTQLAKGAKDFAYLGPGEEPKMPAPTPHKSK
jgi:hypothetical protein